MNVDGLVDPSDAAKKALDAHRLGARVFSPTALEKYAACPYRFYLATVVGLAPREEAEAIDELDPLHRGSLIHDVQRELLSELRDEGLLPVTVDSLGAAMARLNDVITRVAARYSDELAPAIDRVWDDGIVEVRADLREWLARQVGDPWVPAYFELAFGLARSDSDPASHSEPVQLDSGLRLRGSIDLVERRGERLRATDYKTGSASRDRTLVIGGGTALQPVLYALALEKIFSGAQVDSGRLYYCTSRGGFQDRDIRLDALSRERAELVVQTIGRALDEGFLPAAPDEGACRWCDFTAVCGPYEERRSRRKNQKRLADLAKLRGKA